VPCLPAIVAGRALFPRVVVACGRFALVVGAAVGGSLLAWAVLICSRVILRGEQAQVHAIVLVVAAVVSRVLPQSSV
jgi:hypothetical protein